GERGRRVDPCSVPQHRPVRVREQQMHVRPRKAQGTTPSDAGVEDGPDRQRRDPRPSVHPKPATRPLRTGSRGAVDVPAGDRIRRTLAGDLKDPASANDSARPTYAKRNTAVGRDLLAAGPDHNLAVLARNTAIQHVARSTSVYAALCETTAVCRVRGEIGDLTTDLGSARRRSPDHV
ncbi:MAG: hypothetical protein QG597_5121, partial [Actinomycetota bacterium]|nr:hypothetical protein [Actinomycetota bacterium]